jgi:hypothetical protein
MSETQMGAPSWEAWYFNCVSAEILRYCMGSGWRTWYVTVHKSQINWINSILPPVSKWFSETWSNLDDLKTNYLHIINRFTPKKLGIYLWSKVVCLFCFVLYLWDPPNWDASDRLLGVFGKLSTRRGAWAWFRDVWTCSAKVLEYRRISSLKIKLNCSWKFRRNWNVPLVLLERSWWRGNTWANGTGHTSLDEINFQNLLLESPQKKKGKSSRVNADFDFAAQLETLHVGQLHIPNITTMPNP